LILNNSSLETQYPHGDKHRYLGIFLVNIFQAATLPYSPRRKAAIILSAALNGAQ